MAKEDTFKDLEETSEPVLRKRCDKALKQEEGHEDYELARKWCVKKTTISNLLKKRGFRVLSASNNKDDQDWEKLANLPDNEASENRVSFASGINKVDSLKAVCKEFETLDTTADKFNEQLAIAEASCSIKDTISK